MIFILSTNPCENASILATILFIKNIIKIISYIIPAILILLLTVDFAKAVIVGDEKQMKEAQGLAIKRIIYAVIIFLIPIIVNAVFNLIGERGVKGFDCYSNANEDKIIKIQKKEKSSSTQKNTTKQEQSKSNNSSSSSSSSKSNSSSSSQNTDTKPKNLSCTLSYNDVKDLLTFSSSKNAVSYAITKLGATPKFSKKKVSIHPGDDRINSTANYVSIIYTGHVKNKAGEIATCTKEVSVSRGAGVLAYAKVMLGKGYYCKQSRTSRARWDGRKNTLVCTDCCGFVSGLYRHLGKKNFTRDDDKQCDPSKAPTYIVSGKNSSAGARAGDIVCFYRPYSTWYHVAIYTGKTKKKAIQIIEMTGNAKGARARYVSEWQRIVRVKNN